MSDRELLELAAKANGIESILCYESHRNCLRVGDRKSYRLWRPLTDDGDALRLAVKLNFVVTIAGQPHEPPATAVRFYSGCQRGLAERHGDDPAAATRRAIVIAAAEIGRAMP
jgi:hypothetical protein